MTAAHSLPTYAVTEGAMASGPPETDFRQHFLGTILSFVAASGFAGNVVVIAAVLRGRLPNTIYALTVNLAVADALKSLAALHAGVHYFYPSSDKSELGATLCAAVGAMTVLVLAASLLTVDVQSVTRLILMTTCEGSPWRRTVNRKGFAMAAIAIIWLSAVAFLLPPLFGYGKFGFNAKINMCTFRLPSAVDSEKEYVFVVMLAFFVALGIPVCGYFYLSAVMCKRRLPKTARVSDSTLHAERSVDAPASTGSPVPTTAPASLVVVGIGSVGRRKASRCTRRFVNCFAWAVVTMACWGPWIVDAFIDAILRRASAVETTLDDSAFGLLTSLNGVLSAVLHVVIDGRIRNALKAGFRKHPRAALASR